MARSVTMAVVKNNEGKEASVNAAHMDPAA